MVSHDDLASRTWSCQIRFKIVNEDFFRFENNPRSHIGVVEEYTIDSLNLLGADRKVLETKFVRPFWLPILVIHSEATIDQCTVVIASFNNGRIG